MILQCEDKNTFWVLNLLFFFYFIKNISTMTNVNTYEIFNQTDEKYYTLYIKWLNSHFEVILFESSIVPLNGKMDTKDIQYFCEQLSKSCEEYVQETKEIFCGKSKDIQFIIDNTALQWKNNLWILGRIDLNPVSDIKMISECFKQSVQFYQGIQEKLSNIEQKNKELIKENEKLKLDIDKMLTVKSNMELDMYKKFLLLLNSKKRKIQEMKCNIKQEQNTEISVFDASTDENEESDEEGIQKHKKRKSTDDKNSVSMQKTKQSKCTMSKKCMMNECTSPEPSTSKECISDHIKVKRSFIKEENEIIEIDQSCTSEPRQSTSSLKFEESESEEDLFS